MAVKNGVLWFTALKGYGPVSPWPDRAERPQRDLWKTLLGGVRDQCSVSPFESCGRACLAGPWV